MKIRHLIFAAAILMAASAASARQGTLGLGIVFGKPTGISIKHWLTSNTAVDGAIAWSLDSYIQVHGDYLMHTMLPMDGGVENIFFYYGLGGKIEVGRDPRLGVRVPLGIEMLLGTSADVFLELVPVLQLIKSTRFDMDAGLGFRYFF